MDSGERLESINYKLERIARLQMKVEEEHLKTAQEISKLGRVIRAIVLSH